MRSYWSLTEGIFFGHPRDEPSAPSDAAVNASCAVNGRHQILFNWNTHFDSSWAVGCLRATDSATQNVMARRAGKRRTGGEGGIDRGQDVCRPELRLAGLLEWLQDVGTLQTCRRQRQKRGRHVSAASRGRMVMGVHRNGCLTPAMRHCSAPQAFRKMLALS